MELEYSKDQATLIGWPLSVALVASCSALPLMIFVEKKAMTGIPTPYCAPSAFRSLMCTGLAGLVVGDGDVDAALEVIVVSTPPALVTVTTVCGLPDEQALRRSAAA